MTSPAQRPDLAAMAHTIPRPTEPSSVDLQAAAQRATAMPYIEFGGARWYLTKIPNMFDLAELAEAIDAAEAQPTAALGQMNRVLRDCLADYDGLKAAFGAANGRMDDYAKIGLGLYEAVAARPTGAPGYSSAGRTPTSTSSKDGVPSPETAEHDWDAFTRA